LKRLDYTVKPSIDDSAPPLDRSTLGNIYIYIERERERERERQFGEVISAKLALPGFPK